jgi:hypothetical protein
MPTAHIDIHFTDKRGLVEAGLQIVPETEHNDACYILRVDGAGTHLALYFNDYSLEVLRQALTGVGK